MFLKSMHSAVVFIMMCAGVSVQAQGAFNFSKQGHVKTWNQAREMCQKLGKGWDLPLPEHAPLILQREMAPVLDYYELGVATLLRDYVMWVRAENEEHNVQLKDRSIALRYNPLAEEVLEFDLSQKNFEEMSLIKKQLQLIPAQQIRTEAEQQKYIDAVRAFESRYPFAAIAFELYEPYSTEHPLLMSLPSDIFTLEIIGIMLKFSSEYIEVLGNNIDIVLRDFTQGLEVICVSSRVQAPRLGSMGGF